MDQMEAHKNACIELLAKLKASREAYGEVARRPPSVIKLLPGQLQTKSQVAFPSFGTRSVRKAASVAWW